MRELLQELIDKARDIGYYQAQGANCGCCSNPCSCMRAEATAQEETEELLQKFLDKYEPKE